MSEEAAFLAAIRANPTDNLPRLVYADWLDERDRVESGFLRAECELNTIDQANPQRGELQAKLRDTSLEVDPSWLVTVSRGPVENCKVEFRFRCPKRWEHLQLTDEDDVRFCDQCRKKVFFCSSIKIAQLHAALDECVAVDPRLARKPNDLDSSFWDLGTVAVGMISPNEQEDYSPKDED